MGDIRVNVQKATASSYIMPYMPANAANGKINDAKDRWLCTQLPAWLCVDFGVPRWFDRWVVYNLGTTGWPQGYNMKTYKLQTSDDGITWKDVDITVTNNTANNTNKLLPTKQKARFARVYITSGLISNPAYASIAEFGIYITQTAPTLSGLVLNAKGSNLPTKPEFSGTTTSYTSSVTYSADTISITPTATDPYADIAVNTTHIASGGTVNVPLSMGNNTITIRVTSCSGDYMTYTIIVTRTHSASLTNLLLQSGGTDIRIIPDFDKTKNSYTASVDFTTANLTVTPTSEDPTATIAVNGSAVTSGSASSPITLNTGTNNVNVIVSAEGVPQQTYSVVVTKQVDLYLSGLQIKNGKTLVGLTPDFDKTKNTYNGSTTSVTNLMVIASAEAPGDVTLTINTLSATSGTGLIVPVTPGKENQISITVTSKTTGATMVYNCNITVGS